MKQRKLNICLINSTIYEESFPARPEIIEVFGEIFPEFGHKIIWVSPGNTKKIEEIKLKNLTVFLVPYVDSKSSVKSIYNQIKHSIKKWKLVNQIVKKYEIDLIQSRINILNSLIGLFSARKNKIPFLYHMHFPKEIFKIRGNNRFLESKLKSGLGPPLLKYILKKASLILTLNDNLKEYLSEQGYSKSKIYSFTMGINPSKFFPQPRNESLRKELNLSSCFTFIYVGIMSEVRKLEIVIRAFVEVKKVNSNVKLLMIGDGESRGRLEDLTKSLELEEEIIFTGKIPYSDIPQYMCIADVGLTPIPPSDIFRISYPTKNLEYMAVGIPVIGNREIFITDSDITNSKGGVLVDYTEKSFSDAMISLMNNKELVRKIGENGRKWVKNNRSYSIIARNLEEQYYKLLNK